MATIEQIKMLGKTIQLHLSRSAEKKLAEIEQPLCLEMELYFSCLIRKQVRVRDELSSPFMVDVSEKLKIGFRPVMTKTCSVSGCDGEAPPLSDFPIEKPERYIPHWLKLDFRKGQWWSEFGYATPP
ncbi:MAG: hypothetical protein PF589_06475 [Gammaproteobacteria bacterium]|jgi:hypothetical protein|nr:hypothetical protein [Gammaproteobacteria bacterium]